MTLLGAAFRIVADERAKRASNASVAILFRQEMVNNIGSTSPSTDESDVVWVAAKGGDMVVYPLEGCPLVVKTCFGK